MKFILFIIQFVLVTHIAFGQEMSVDVAVKINNLDTVIEGQNLVVGSEGQIAIKKYNIGDMAHGGIIFYIDPTGNHGLVADTADLTNGIIWRNQSTIRTNAVSQNIGGGKINTILISSLQIPEDPNEDFAALICLKLDKGNYGDWFLPSSDELMLLYNNLHQAGLGNFPFPNLSYWSSSEVDQNHALYLNFSTGAIESGTKDILLAVRPVRSF